ncbi:hypothetical protein N9580_03720, partial [Flavobacteriales bacterium]|nr:hypothetical protein [Flavobacteriales bacterium]
GAISIQGSPSTIDIVNNTVSGNSCYHGGGIQCESSNNNITINNSIFYNNYSLLNNSPSEIELELTSLNNVISVSNSNIYGSEAGIVGGYVGTINWANTNIDVDPLFNDPVNGDYRLSNFSPCIGAGLDTSIIPTTDILGNPRPNPAGSNTDMGAYENALALPDVLGCMDSLATNYNASANISDSSCTNCYATADIGADTISGCDSVLISTNTITNGSYSWITSDISTLGIGDTYQGGIVFYLDSLGGGLIAAPFDQSIGGHEWGCSFDTISGANGTSFGTGAQNTIDIVNANCTPFTPGYGIAANVCDTLTLGGYSDWFLPSKDELNEMYSNKNSIGGFVNSSHYWSSSEANNTSAWTHHFAGWGSSQSGKLSNLEVRAIRAFQPINPDTTNSVMVSTSGWNYVTVTDSLGCTAMDSVYVIVNTSGCTDPSAGNYDINATCDDGSCCYADTSYTNITACDSVVWNGVTYDSSGQFTFMPDFMQIGQDIDGEAYDDHSGKSVSISADGNIVAIGAFLNDGNGSNSGHVRVYESVGGSWSQIGQDIDGESPGDLSGRSVSISDDGNIVAIGAIGNDGNGSNSGHVRIYQNIGGSWSQIGGDIDGEAADDASGYSVSLNSDGNTVAIGARLNDGDGGNSGHVRIYNYNGSSWNQLGQDIDGSGGSQSGYSVSLCADGSIVAIGAPYSYHQGYQDAGHVRMYENVSGSWQQIGSDIFGDNASDLLGFSVSLSNNGETVAVGAPTMGSTATSLGYVRIFDNIGGSWIQIGQDIDAEVPYSGHGSSVSLNSDGNKVAIGPTGAAGVPINVGLVRIHQNIGGTWSQIGQDIVGEAAGDYDKFVSLSADGNTVAIGAAENDGNGASAGHVRVYNLPTLTNAGGCDSTAILNLTITNANTSTTTVISCDSYTWNGTTYTSSGSYSWSGTNMEACDSTATLNLTINNSSTSDTYVSVCDTDYTWNGVTYTVTGDYTYVTTNSVGCDSTATLHLTVSYSNSGSESVTACDSYFWQGTNYTISGVYTNTLTNIALCDSIATLNLTINNSYPSSSNITDYYICNGQSVTIANNTY